MRLFVALDLPWVLRERLAALAGSGIPGARWVPPDNYHLTLRFIGQTPGYRAEDIDTALSGLRARGFALTLSGLGTFEKSGRSTAIWVGAERNPQLDHLQNKIETALQRCGLEPERRRFQPHVTLARLDNVPEGKLVSFVQAHNLFRAEPVPVEHFHAVQLAVGEGGFGVYRGSGVRAGLAVLPSLGSCGTAGWLEGPFFEVSRRGPGRPHWVVLGIQPGNRMPDAPAWLRVTLPDFNTNQEPAGSYLVKLIGAAHERREWRPCPRDLSHRNP